MKTIGSNTQIRRNPGQVFSEIDGQVVMLNVKKEVYYSLNDIGSDIWRNLSKTCSMDDLINKLTSTYEVPAERCKEDIEPFLAILVEAGVIEVSDD